MQLQRHGFLIDAEAASRAVIGFGASGLRRFNRVTIKNTWAIFGSLHRRRSRLPARAMAETTSPERCLRRRLGSGNIPLHGPGTMSVSAPPDRRDATWADVRDRALLDRLHVTTSLNPARLVRSGGRVHAWRMRDAASDPAGSFRDYSYDSTALRTAPLSHRRATPPCFIDPSVLRQACTPRMPRHAYLGGRGRREDREGHDEVRSDGPSPSYEKHCTWSAIRSSYIRFLMFSSTIHNVERRFVDFWHGVGGSLQVTSPHGHGSRAPLFSCSLIFPAAATGSIVDARTWSRASRTSRWCATRSPRARGRVAIPAAILLRRSRTDAAPAPQRRLTALSAGGIFTRRAGHSRWPERRESPPAPL
jgi:hypothetical protein